MQTQVPTFLRPVADRFLTYLARSDSALSLTMFRMVERLFPRAAARVYFRRGMLTRALDCAQRADDPLQVRRLEKMVHVIQSPLPEKPDRGFGTQFNGRVLQIVHSSMSYDLNGYAVRTEQIGNALAQQNVTCDFVTRLGYPWDLLQHLTRDQNPPYSKSKSCSYAHRADPQHGIGGDEEDYIERYSNWIIERSEDFRPTILHAHSNYLNGLAAYRAGLHLELPVIYEVRGLWHKTRGLRDPRYRDSEHYQYCEKQELVAARLADAVVTLSEPMADWLRRSGIAESAISVIGNASTIRAPVTQSTKHFTVGYVGSFAVYEGLDLLVRAMRRICDKRGDIRLVLVGDGSEYRKLRHLVRNLRLTNQVSLPGRIDRSKVDQFYENIDLAVLPRYANEVTELVPPLKPMELMAAGVPYIASDVAPLLALANPELDYAIFPAGNDLALAERIVLLADDRGKLVRLRESGLKWAHKHSWDHNAKEYIRLYKNLVGS